jgi:hypothetical protein
VAVLNPDAIPVDKDSPKGSEPGQGDPAKPGDGFRFPKDSGGQYLGKLLPPRENFVLPAERPSGPRPQPALRALENPTLAVPPGQVGMARLPQGKATRPARPGAMLEETPLLGYRETPAPPRERSLSPGLLVKAPSPNVSQPVPPPVLGQPTPDRAPLDDPTPEASQAAALMAQMPARTNPAPFLKLTLPDPFENRQTGRLRTTPPEEGIPVAATPRLPK